MRIAVVGAGVIGVCTAYFLAESGHEVVVIERRNNVAEEASFGEAGILATGSIAPWAAPGMPSAFFSALWKSCAPIRLDSKLSPAMWRWIRLWKKECELARYQINRERMHRLSAYSSDLMLQLRERYQLDYEQSSGFLQLFRTEQDRQLAQTALKFLSAHGIAHAEMDADGIRQIEPALGSSAALAGGIFFPDDGAGNCPLFTRQMRSLAQALGVEFHFGATVRSITQQDGGVALQIDGQNFSADAVVLATGADSAALLQGLGINLPVYPVRNYAATVAIRNFDSAPMAALMDEHYKVAITRMDNRIRIAGTAELGTQAKEGSSGRNIQSGALHTLLTVANDWFPDACNYNTATFWSGSSLMLPDGPPVIGETAHKNVFVNIGHGSGGWTMAAGAGKLVAALVARDTADIDMHGFSPARYV
jgi:D-amino-acid dehydrogenase